MSDMPFIYLDNSYTVRHAWTGDNLTTGEREPATGLTVTAFLSATQTASSPIHVDLSLTLDEIGTTGVIDGDPYRRGWSLTWDKSSMRL